MLKLSTDRHETSRGLSATAGILFRKSGSLLYDWKHHQRQCSSVCGGVNVIDKVA